MNQQHQQHQEERMMMRIRAGLLILMCLKKLAKTQTSGQMSPQTPHLSLRLRHLSVNLT